MLVQNSANRRTSLFFCHCPLKMLMVQLPSFLRTWRSERSERSTWWRTWLAMTCHCHPLGMARSAVSTATYQNLSAELLHFTPVWNILKRQWCRTDSRCCAWSGQTPAACCAETSSIAILTSAIEAWHILAHLTLGHPAEYSMSRSENGSANKGMPVGKDD